MSFSKVFSRFSTVFTILADKLDISQKFPAVPWLVYQYYQQPVLGENYAKSTRLSSDRAGATTDAAIDKLVAETDRL